jgi:hypothetical protein
VKNDEEDAESASDIRLVTMYYPIKVGKVGLPGLFYMHKTTVVKRRDSCCLLLLLFVVLHYNHDLSAV